MTESVKSTEKVLYEEGAWVIITTMSGNYYIDHKTDRGKQQASGPLDRDIARLTICTCCDREIPENVLTFIRLLEL